MIKRFVIKLIKFYQKYIRGLNSKDIGCKFYPTCSDYTIQAIEKYGTIKGIAKGIWRILRCNPFLKGGYDPVKWGINGTNSNNYRCYA